MRSSTILSPIGLLAAGALAVGCGGGGSGGGGSASVAPPLTAAFGVTTVGPLSKARAWHTATALPDGRILIAGGLTGPNAATAEVEILDPSTGAVTSARPMGTARLQHAAILLPIKKVLVIGGQSDRFGAALDTTELYDPATNTWTAGPKLSAGRAGAAIAAYEQGKKVLVAGGFTWANGSMQALRTADIYKADSNTVQASSSQMRSARAGGQALAQTNGQVLLASGFASAGAPAPSEVYDIATDQFVAVSMATTRGDAALAVIDSKLHGIGGVTSAGAALASVETFDGQSFSGAADLRRARGAFTASTVPASGTDGIIVGGRDGATVLDSIELYPSGTAPVSSLSDARHSHTATAVGDRVYVIGGFGTNDDLLASIEVIAHDSASLPGAGAPKGTRVNAKASPPAAQVSVTALSPNSGAAGTRVEITGAGFDQVLANNVVRFNGTAALVAAVDAAGTKLTVTVPAGATTGPVTVQLGTVVATGPIFTIGAAGPTGPPPRILFVLPNSARPFFPVSITGQDFGTQPVVTFNGVPTINIVNLRTRSLPIIGSVSELVVIVPPGATTGPLSVHNGTAASNPFHFTVN